MVNDCIRIGIEHDVSATKSLAKLCYPQLSGYNIVTYYKINAISKAAGILANRKQSIKRGYPTKKPYLKEEILISSYGFKITNRMLQVPLGNRQYQDIPLNLYVRKILAESSLNIRSFTITSNNNGAMISICYSKEVLEKECTNIEGIDRNLKNLTAGNATNVTQYDLSKTTRIAKTTRNVMSSFKRNDARIRKGLYQKYGRRRRNRINQVLHKVSKTIVNNADNSRSAIVFERLTYIRRMYQRGNYQGSGYRAALNDWSFSEIKRQIEYKAAWLGVTVIQLSSSETRGTSQLCPQCGKRLQEAHYKDTIHKRQLWCPKCKTWMDRDVVAAMNIAKKGGEVFHRSKGAVCEAMKRDPMAMVILRVDAAKLGFRCKSEALQNPKPRNKRQARCS